MSILLSGDEQTKKGVDGDLRRRADPWVTAMHEQWPDGLPKNGLHPCVWVQWAVTRRGTTACSEVLDEFGKWQTRLLYDGLLAVMKSKRSDGSKSDDASLRPFGAADGHGIPAHLFVLEEFRHDVLKVKWRVKPCPLAATRRSGMVTSRKPAPATHPPQNRRGRGSGVTLSVEAAFHTLSQRDESIKRVAVARENGVRFVATKNREELFRLISTDKHVKNYAETTIKAVLAGIVSTPRGRPKRK